MRFEDSIRVCFSKYADFKGCAVRSEYWWWVLFTVLAGAVLSMAGETVSGVFSLLTLLPTLAVGARRLHDINRSGWWQLIWFLPIIGWILLLYWFASEGVEPNRFD